MSTTRRGFLKMLGVGTAAVAVGPTLLNAIPAPKVSAVIKTRTFAPGELNGYMERMGRRMSQEILRVLSQTNPYLELLDGVKRPTVEYLAEVEEQKRDVAAYWRSENPDRY